MSSALRDHKKTPAVQRVLTKSRANGLKLLQGMFMSLGDYRLVSMKDFFTERVAGHWNRLPKEVIVSLEVFKKCVSWFIGRL